MSPKSGESTHFKKTEQGKKNSINFSQTVLQLLACVAFLLSHFLGFTLIFHLLLLYFYQLHRFEKSFFPDWTMFLYPFTCFISWAYTFKLLSWFYISISNTQWTPPFTESGARKLITWGKKKKSKRPGQPEPGQQAACGPDSFSSPFPSMQHIWGCSPHAASGNISHRNSWVDGCFGILQHNNRMASLSLC